MANLSVYDEMIKYLEAVLQDKQEEDAAPEVVISIKTAIIAIEVGVVVGKDHTAEAIRCLVLVDLIKEADNLFTIWWEA